MSDLQEGWVLLTPKFKLDLIIILLNKNSDLTVSVCSLGVTHLNAILSF
ncbi:hypothetical protein Glo7428_0371 [Gloeocapsa sp. PCC 7428]|nr:hypothetical protein Glo7428_0371 [Gloeocapsa sp. PCC 7428]